MTDSTLLAEIALQDDLAYSIRHAAIEQLVGHPVLATIALNESNEITFRLAAIESMTDPSLLDEIAKSDSDIAYKARLRLERLRRR